MSYSEDYARIAEVIRYLRGHAQRQPRLDELAAQAGLSAFHFQRLFQRFAGVSPKRFLQHLTAEYARRLLRESRSVLDAGWEAGLSGGGRLHDLLLAVDAVTPGAFKSGGAGLVIRWGIQPSPFGACLVGVTERGICALQFVENDAAAAVERLRHDWPAARLDRNQPLAATTVGEIFARLDGDGRKPLSLLLKGTNLQLQVWRALLTIPDGRIASYGQIAAAIGRPGAARAVGRAVGDNPIAWLIPCHRVLRSDGNLGGYRWGEERKLAILGREWGQAESAP